MADPDDLDKLIQTAIQQDRLRELILGEPGFEFLPRYSPSPWRTDHAVVLSRLAVACRDQEIANRVGNSVADLADTYEGVVPAATCFLFEVLSQRKGDMVLGLDLDKLATLLRETVGSHQQALRIDKRGAGSQWPDGLYGELKHINAICLELGGTGFLGCDA